MVTSTFAFSISIHAPREGGDFTASNKNAAESIFQSTPPARGATRRDHLDGHGAGDFNPRPPRGGRRKTVLHGIRINLISIHAPREGGDDSGIGPLDKRLISIHAPREGGVD